MRQAFSHWASFGREYWNVADPAAFRDLCTSERPTHVFHAAHPPRDETPEVLNHCYHAMTNILDAAKELGIKRVVYSSSASIYGQLKKPDGELVQEDDSVSIYPTYFYRAAKTVSEWMGDFYKNKHGVDFVAVSFVRSPNDITEVRKFLREQGADIPIVAKLERHEVLANLPGVLTLVDAVMVARGDLGVELPFEQVPLVQKRLIREANLHGRPVITATQMLESMMHAPEPTRAEASDVANAILDGTSALMLSGVATPAVSRSKPSRTVSRDATRARSLCRAASRDASSGRQRSTMAASRNAFLRASASLRSSSGRVTTSRSVRFRNQSRMRRAVVPSWPSM